MPHLSSLRLKSPYLNAGPKKRLNRRLGITAVKRPFRAPGNMKRRFLRRAGYYSGPMKFFRFMGRVLKK